MASPITVADETHRLEQEAHRERLPVVQRRGRAVRHAAARPLPAGARRQGPCRASRPARKIVEEHRQEVERIAEALPAKGDRSGDELRDLIAQQPRLKLVDHIEKRAGQKWPVNQPRAFKGADRDPRGAASQAALIHSPPRGLPG